MGVSRRSGRKHHAHGFDFSHHLRFLCEDLIARLPELSHIDMSRVALSVSQARKSSRYGVYASLTPLRFKGGMRAGKLRGRYYRTQSVRDKDGLEMLYILTCYLPRFMEVVLREKLVTVVHELWHISPEFDGDIRRHEGRCYAHTGSRTHYDREMEVLVDRWLAAEPPRHIYQFLEYDFGDLQRIYGGIFGTRYARPKMTPIPASEAHGMNREQSGLPAGRKTGT